MVCTTEENKKNMKQNKRQMRKGKIYIKKNCSKILIYGEHCKQNKNLIKYKYVLVVSCFLYETQAHKSMKFIVSRA